MNKKLQYKLLLGALMIVFAVCAAITVVASIIISRQNRDLVHMGMDKSMSVIRDSLVEKQTVLFNVIDHMVTANKLGDDVKFLNEFKDSGLNLVRQSYEKLGNIMANTSIQENLYRLQIYSKEGRLLNYIVQKDPENLAMGFYHDSLFHHRDFRKEEAYTRIPFKEVSEIEEIKLPKTYGFEIPQENRILFDRSENFLSLKIIIPVHANFYNKETEKSEPALCGFVVAEERLSDDYITRMERITGMDMNLFVDNHFSAGKMAQYKQVDISKIPENTDEKWKINNQPVFFNDIKIADQRYFEAILPLYNQEKFLGGLLILQSDAVVKANTRQMIFMIGIVAFVCMIFVIPLASVAAGKIVRPLIEIVEKLKDIAEGEGDLTNRLKVQSKDEIGQVAQWFNTFIDKIHGLITEVAKNSGELNQSSSTLSHISRNMMQGAEQTSSRANSVSAASEEMSSSMASVASAMEQASGNMGMVASATEEMSQTINEISKNTAIAKQITNDVVQKTNDASNQIKELGTAAESIGHVVEAIADISAQVNLLALNATIEAARAGESGKGFAVVAGEIKTLAAQTANATREIKEKVENIRSSTVKTVAQINMISTVVHQVNEIVVNVAASVENQSAATRDISGNIVQVTQGIEMISSNITQSSDVSMEIAKDITAVTVTANEMTNCSIEVEGGSKNLSGLSEKLMRLVNKFKI